MEMIDKKNPFEKNALHAGTCEGHVGGVQHGDGVGRALAVAGAPLGAADVVEKHLVHLRGPVLRWGER